ncbi:MAG: phosphoribosylformylglycinamidine synthase subunit PurL [Dehalococcoidia bacterium]
MKIDKTLLDEIALSEKEYEKIVELMGRSPNHLELGLFGSMWSEHCGYKHSKHLIKTLPSQSSRVLSESGQENAGAIDIGDGYAVVFKVESHNHPSAVEPFQGAATGVGGIVRDILAMGARPIAILNSLRFGPPGASQTDHIFNGVVDGISWYGNCLGIPNVGGEIYFDHCYEDNPLVNALCVGLVKADNIASSSAKSVGNTVLLVGAETGRDGIHGASGLASRNLDSEQEMRPTVQVGNPFLEKLLIEGCLEALETGHVEGIQDCGAAGLTSSTVEAASKAGLGITINTSKVPAREEGMTPYEIMLSESQERMILFVRPEYVSEISLIFTKWGMYATDIGEVIQSPQIVISDGTNDVAQIPIQYLTDAPSYSTNTSLAKLDSNKNTLHRPAPILSPQDTLVSLLSSQNIGSKESVYQKYDSQVQTNTLIGPQHSAAVLRIKGTTRMISLSIDCNSRYCFLDPYIGSQIAVAEACRNVSCTGATPIALTDCLNFANPERPEIYLQLEQSISGMGVAAQIFDTPIVSGNASLYNQSDSCEIYPTPIIGCLGLMPNSINPCKSGFVDINSDVFILGTDTIHCDSQSLSGSEYYNVMHHSTTGTPFIDLELEFKVQALCRDLISQNLILSAHDCSEGGLAVSLAESCSIGNIGFKSSDFIFDDWEADLFGETQSRIVVSCHSTKSQTLIEIAQKASVPIIHIGSTTQDSFQLGNSINSNIITIKDAWQSALP